MKNLFKYLCLIAIFIMLSFSLSYALEFDLDTDGYIDIDYMPLDELWTFQAGVTISTTKALTLGTTQWDDGSDKINGEQIADDTIDDDSIDFTDVTLLDFGLAITHDTSTELDALYEAELNNSAGLLAALSDETGTGTAVFSISPTFTGTVVFPSGQALIAPALGTIASGVGTTLTALNGENIQDNTIDEDSIDFGTGTDQVSLLDFGLAITHDTSTELDALYEAELNNSAGLLAALSDETGTGYAVFSASPTFTGVETHANDSIANTAIYSGTTSLDETTAADDSGASIIGVFDEFSNSNADNVQDVLDDLDAAILAAGSGDVTAAGDCASGECLDGSVDGGTSITLYDAQGATTLSVGDNAAAVALTLPIVTGTLLTADGVGTSLTALNGENIQDDTIDEDSIDWGTGAGQVSLLDLGLAITHDTSTELDALYEAELDNSAGLLAALSDETGTGVAVFGTAPTFTTGITITGANADPAAAGAIVYDTTVTGLADGALAWYDQDEIRYIVDLDTLPVTDGYVVSYNATDDKFEMTAASSTATDFALTAEADAGDYDIKSINGLYGVDDQVYIDMGTNGYLDLEADTGIRITAPTDFGDEDLTSIDKLEGFDADVYVDLGTDGRIIISANGAGTPFATPDIDITGTSYFDADTGFPIDTKIYFGDALVFIESDADGYLDLDADTGIRLNGPVIGSGNLYAATYGSDSSITDAELKIIDDGATTEILVGGGAGVIPVWTTATGTGAPVRAGDPAFTGFPTTPSALPDADYEVANKAYVDQEVSGAGAGLGDVLSVGDCLTGICLDGTSDGGTNITFYNVDSNKTQLIASDTAADLVITLPAATGTLLNADGSGASLTAVDAATGDSATDFFDAGEIADARISDTLTATTIVVADNEDTAESNAVIFSSGADIDGGSYQLESDGDFLYTPSTGTVTATTFVGAVDSAGTVSANLFTPDAADGADIGSAALYFSDVYLADASIIKFGDDQDVTLTHVADTGLLLNLELEVDGTLDADGVVALGDGGDNFSVASDGIDIDTSGNITNAGTIGSGAVTSTGAVQGTSLTDGTGTMSSGALSGITTIGASGIITSTNATEASAIGTAAVVTAGGLGVTKDIWVGDDIVLDSDSAVISFGADQDVTLTHTADTGLAVNLNFYAATYGSDASISDAELKTLDDGATTEILVGGGAGSTPVWTTASGSGAPVRAVSPTLTGNPGLSTLLLTALTAEPTEVVGQIYRADNDTWDPCGIDGTDDYFVICTAEDTYIALWDIAGNFYFASIAAPMKVIPDTSGGRAIAASEMNSVIYLTDDGPFDVDIPDGECDAAADIGKWVTVMTDADNQASLTSLDASNHFINDDLTDFGAGDELDIDGNMVTVMCIAAEYWKVTGWTGAQPTDGGAAD